MLLLAFIGGFFWDAQCALGPHGGDPEIYTQQVESLRFGYSILLFGGMGFLMQGIQPLFKQGKWQFSALLSGIAVLLYLAAEYAIINRPWRFRAYQGHRPADGVHRPAHHALFPLIFWLLFRIARACNYSINPKRAAAAGGHADPMEPGYRIRIYLLRRWCSWASARCHPPLYSRLTPG